MYCYGWKKFWNFWDEHYGEKVCVLAKTNIINGNDNIQNACRLIKEIYNSVNCEFDWINPITTNYTTNIIKRIETFESINYETLLENIYLINKNFASKEKYNKIQNGKFKMNIEKIKKLKIK